MSSFKIFDSVWIRNLAFCFEKIMGGFIFITLLSGPSVLIKIP